MRVLVVMSGSSCTGSGGAERRFARLHTHLRDRGQDVHLLVNSSLHATLAGTGILPGRVRGVLVVDDPATGRGRAALRFSRRAREATVEIEPAVVHLPLIQRSLIPYYLWLGARSDVGVTSTVALSHLAHGAPVSAGTALAARLLLGRSDVIDSLYEPLSRHRPRLADRIRVSPCSFTDPERFRPAASKRREIVFAGRLDRGKNPLLLLKAVSMLRATRPGLAGEWTVRILGQGPLERDVHQLVDRERLGDLVSVGAAPCIAPALSSSMIFTSLQRVENYPSQSLLEAMACANAVVATDVGDTRRLVDEEVGVLATPDPEVLAAALGALMADTGLCARLGAAARRRVLSDHRIDRFADHMMEVWSHAARQP